MDAILKKRLVSALKSLIKNIESGTCDNMTTDQYNSLIECLNKLVEIEIENKKCRKLWKW